MNLISRCRRCQNKQDLKLSLRTIIKYIQVFFVNVLRLRKCWIQLVFNQAKHFCAQKKLLIQTSWLSKLVFVLGLFKFFVFYWKKKKKTNKKHSKIKLWKNKCFNTHWFITSLILLISFIELKQRKFPLSVRLQERNKFAASEAKKSNIGENQFFILLKMSKSFPLNNARRFAMRG